VPERGSKVHYFGGAVLQGVPAPSGFGVRVTAAGVRSFILNFRAGRRERRITIGQNIHARTLDILSQDTRMIRAAVNDIARVDVTAGEVEVMHDDINRLRT
jgi:hypothetical protein